MLSLRAAGNGKKLGMFLDNTPENREKMMLITNALVNGDLTEIHTLNGIAKQVETHLSYVSEKFEWLVQENLQMKEIITALARKLEEYQAPPITDVTKKVVVPKRKPGRPSDEQINLWREQYTKLILLHRKYAIIRGVNVLDSQAMAAFWGTIYGEFADEYEYYPSRDSSHPRFGSKHKTKLMTVILDGVGEELIDFLNNKTSASKPDVVLRLNPAFAAH
ncbi:hypothetical protein V5G20_18075 [Brevibacillus borstelensis]|uniref:hypothetical protein n=1 Tax=Brevibacillus borstelensis TaxID=45462 RepID=UPI0030D5B877